MPVGDTVPLYPPAVRPPRHKLPAPGYILRLLQNPLRIMPEEVYREPIVVYPGVRRPHVWVTDPGLIAQVLLEEPERYLKTPIERRILGPTLGDGLLTASGASWRWQRKVAAPLFRHADILAYVPAMTAAAQARLEAWRGCQRPGQPFTSDIGAAMKVATFDVIASTILAGCQPREAAVIKQADITYMSGVNWELAAGVIGLKENTWHPRRRQMQTAAAQGRAAVLSIVERRRAAIAVDPAAASAGDVLARLLAARHPDTGEPMSDAMVVDNLATFLEAGHLTTSQALTWTLYLLARASAWQDAVRAEVQSVLAKGPLTDPVAQLPLTVRVLKESMRLYPPVPTVVRIADTAGTLGGIPIPAATTVIVSIYAAHRHHARWIDPGRFDPGRFLPDREAAMPRGQYLPFGFGQRTCIGMTFALIEGVAILATLIAGARFDWDGRHLPEPLSRLTLTPKGGMPLRVTMQ